MSDSQTLAIQIRVGADGLVEGLKVATKGVEETAQIIKAGFTDIKKSGHEAGGAMDEFVGHIRGMRREAFLGNFMAKQIAEVGIASKGAAAEFTGLVSAFALGGGVGVAVEGVKLLLKAFHEFGEEEKKATEEFEKWKGTLEEGTKKLADSVTDELMRMHGATNAEMLAHKELMPLYDQERELAEKLRIAKSNLAAANESEATDEKDVIAKSAAIIQAQKEITDLVQRHSAVLKQISERGEQVDILGGAEDVEKAKKASEEAEKIAREHETKLAQIHAEALTGQDKLNAEFEAKRIGILNNEKLTEKQKEEEIQAELQVLWAKLGEARQAALDKQLAAHAAHLNKVIDAEFKASQAIRKMFAEQDKYREDLAKRISDQQKKASDEQIRDAERVGTALGQTFAGLMDTSKSAAAVVTELAKQMLKLLIDNAIKSVTAHAAEGAAGAAASQAAIPIAGPVLAIGAMSAIEAAVLGLISIIPSASGGFDIPRSINPVTQLHGGEMVLPAQYADVIRGLAGGDGGGGDVHLHIKTVFADKRSLQDLAQHPDFIRGIREARRNGALD